MDRETIRLKLLPGVAPALRYGSRGNFCIQPDGSSAYIFIDKSNTFAVVNLKTGEHALIKTKTSNEFSAIPKKLSKAYDKKGVWLDFVAVCRASKIFIIALRSVQKDYFVVSFLSNAGSISVVDVHLTGIEVKIDSEAVQFQKDGDGELYFLSYGSNRSKTSYNVTVAKIDVGESGKICSAILASHSSLSGRKCLPLVHLGSISWLSTDNWLDKLFKLSLTEESKKDVDIVEITNNEASDVFFCGFEWNSPIVAGKNMNIICYARNLATNYGILLILIWEEKRWRKISINDSGHEVVRRGFDRLSAHSANGFLFLHAQCSLSSCNDKAHVYIADINKYDQLKVGDVAAPVPQVVVLFPFEDKENNLSVGEGEILTLVDKNDSAWWRIRKEDGSEGYVPAAYVKELDGANANEAASEREEKENTHLLAARSQAAQLLAAAFAERLQKQRDAESENIRRQAEEEEVKRREEELERAESLRRVHEEERARRRAAEEDAERMQREREAERENTRRRAEEEANRREDSKALQQALEKAESLRRTLDEENARRRAVEEDAERMQREISRRQAEAEDKRREESNALQQALEKAKNIHRALEEEKSHRRAAEIDAERLQREREAERENARRQAEEEKVKRREENNALQQALEKVENLRRALEEENACRRAVEQEIKRLQREREFENVRQKTVQMWAPDTYEKDMVLGIGNFGIVFKCWDTKRRRYFVAKKTNAALKGESIISLIYETKRLKDLCHPRIVEYYGFKFEEDGMVIFMEYMPLGSVGDLIKQYGPVVENTVTIYVSQILDGLAYLHDKAIVHCDLKCDNLLSDHNGNIKIGDFGLAVQKYLNAAKESNMNPRSDGQGGETNFWRDPEFYYTNLISRKSDIWSLGCTIVEMLTMEPPYFELRTTFRLIAARAQNLLSYDPKELVPGATVQMQNFIGCLLQINSTNRPADATEATKTFRIFLN